MIIRPSIVPEHQYQFLSSSRVVNAEITIRTDGSDVVVDKPTVDLVRGGNHISWWISNETTTSHSVTVRNFRVKTTGEAEFPFDDPEPTPVVVGPGAKQRIKLKTKAQTPDYKKGAWVYTYDVEVDGSSVEPEIVIEWPT